MVRLNRIKSLYLSLGSVDLIEPCQYLYYDKNHKFSVNCCLDHISLVLSTPRFCQPWPNINLFWKKKHEKIVYFPRIDRYGFVSFLWTWSKFINQSFKLIGELAVLCGVSDGGKRNMCLSVTYPKYIKALGILMALQNLEFATGVCVYKSWKCSLIRA